MRTSWKRKFSLLFLCSLFFGTIAIGTYASSIEDVHAADTTEEQESDTTQGFSVEPYQPPSKVYDAEQYDTTTTVGSKYFGAEQADTYKLGAPPQGRILHEPEVDGTSMHESGFKSNIVSTGAASDCESSYFGQTVPEGGCGDGAFSGKSSYNSDGGSDNDDHSYEWNCKRSGGIVMGKNECRCGEGKQPDSNGSCVGGSTSTGGGTTSTTGGGSGGGECPEGQVMSSGFCVPEGGTTSTTSGGTTSTTSGGTTSTTSGGTTSTTGGGGDQYCQPWSPGQPITPENAGGEACYQACLQKGGIEYFGPKEGYPPNICDCQCNCDQAGCVGQCDNPQDITNPMVAQFCQMKELEF